jgi:hypothetical protein
MQRLSDWASGSPWRTIIALPILLPYVIWKIPGALKEWGEP